MAKYFPEQPTGPQIDADKPIIEWVFRELNRLSEAIQSVPLNLEETFVEPPKPQEGDTAFADGTSWNPGSGQGIYAYVNGAWVKLNLSATDNIIVNDITVNDDLTVEGDANFLNADVFTPPAGNWEFIRADSPSSVASVDWTSLSAFRFLKLIGFLRPATDAVGLLFRTDSDNGASFDAGAADYNTAFLFQSGAAAGATDATNGTSFNPTISNIGNVAPEGAWFELLITEFNQASHAGFLCMSFQLTSATAHLSGLMTGRRLSTTARNALRVLFSSGNIASGRLQLFGIRG